MNFNEITQLYISAVDNHPIRTLVAAGKMPRKVLDDFAVMHYGFSTSWGPVIGTVKDRANTPKFREALIENMRDELGINGTSHITLCYAMLTSIGLVPHYAGNDMISIASHPTEIMNAVGELSEAQAAGYMFSSESLVPHVFALFLPAFVATGADTRYLDEHIEIDVDKHSQMLEEAVMAVYENSSMLDWTVPKAPEVLQGIVEGIHFGGRSIVGPIDCLYFKALQLLVNEKESRRKTVG